MANLTLYATTATSSTWTNVNNATGNTPNTFASVVGTRNVTKTITLSGFDSSSIPDDAIVSSVSITIKCREQDPGSGETTITSSLGSLDHVNSGTANINTTTFNGNYLKSDITNLTVDIADRLTVNKGTFNSEVYYCQVDLEYSIPEPISYKIYCGETQIKKIYLQNTDITSVFLGSSKI